MTLEFAASARRRSVALARVLDLHEMAGPVIDMNAVVVRNPRETSAKVEPCALTVERFAGNRTCRGRALG